MLPRATLNRKPGVYPTGDLKSWVVTLGIDELGQRVGYRGTASGVEITRVGPSGRAVEVTVTGSGSPLTIAGPRFDAALGLRSTMFTITQSATRQIATDESVEVLALGTGRPLPASDPNNPGTNSGASADEGPLEFTQTGLLPDDATVVTSDTTVTATDTAPIFEDASPAGDVVGAETTVPTTRARVLAGRSPSQTSAPADIVDQSGQVSELAFLGAVLVPLLGIGAFVRRRRSHHATDLSNATDARMR